MHVSLLARPDHSVELYRELTRLNVAVDYYTFHAFRESSLAHRAFPDRKTVPASAHANLAFTLAAYPLARLGRHVPVNTRRLESLLARLLLHPRRPPEGSVVHYWPLFFLPFVSRLRRTTDVVTLADYYEAEPSFANERFRRAYADAGLPFSNPFNELIDHNASFKMETDFVVASEFTRQSYLQRFPTANIHVVSYGLMGRRIERNATLLPRKRWVFVGRVCLEKGVSDLLRAFDGLPDLSLDVIGPVAAEQAEYFESLRSKLARVRFLGAMRHSQVLRALPTYDAMVLPSVCDNYSLAVTEALCAGLPVVVTDSCGNATDVRRFGLGAVSVTHSADALRNAIAHVAEVLPQHDLQSGLSAFDDSERSMSYGMRMLSLYRALKEARR